MNKLLIIAAFVLCMVSCANNDADIAPTDDLVQMQFNVNALNVDNEPMNAKRAPGATRAAGDTGTDGTETGETATPLSSKVNEINYIIQNVSTGKTYQGKQTPTDAGDEFGTIKLWIAPGTYKTFITAQNIVDGDGGTFLTGLKYDGYSFAYIYNINRDVFYYLDKQLTISKDMPSVDVNMSRENGKVVLQLTDDFPEEIKSIKLTFSVQPAWNCESSSTYNLQFPPKQEITLPVKDGKVAEWGFFMHPGKDHTLTIAMIDADDNELGTTNVTYSIYQNRRTIIHGNLTDVIKQKPFVITISDDWGTDVDVPLK